MLRDILNNISKSFKYHDFETMKFLSSCIYKKENNLRILLPVSLYYGKEYSRALFFLSEMNTYTSKYYEALCYIKQKNYIKAITEINKILEGKLKEDISIHENIDHILIDKNDKEYLHNLLGNLYTLVKDRDSAIKSYLESFLIFPLFSATENLICEDCIPLTQNINEELYIKNYIHDIIDVNKSNVNEKIVKYKDLIPGIGSYFISNVAKKFFEMGFNEMSKKYFIFVSRYDPKFVYNADFYSTVLWHSNDITELGLLCKNLIIDHPKHPATWKALGNFYNHKNDYNRSMICLKRALYIYPEYYTYTLLGFESIQKNEFEVALKYFKRSILMMKNNFRSILGCALVYSKMEKKENAEYFFKSAIELCPENKQVKIFAMKFFIKKGDIDTTIDILSKGLNAPSKDVNMIIEHILNNAGTFSEFDEFMILEFIDILVKLDLLKLAKMILDSVESRGETYYKKKEMVNEKLGSAT